MTRPTNGSTEQADRLFDRLRRHGGGRAGGRSSAVQHEDIDAAERLERRRDESLEVLRDREIALHRKRSDAVGLALEEVAAPAHHRDVGALGGEPLGDRETHAGRGAADDGRAA